VGGQPGVTVAIDRMVPAFAESLIHGNLLPAKIHSGYGLWFTAFVGVNLLQAAFIGFCPLVQILKALGFRPGEAFK